MISLIDEVANAVYKNKNSKLIFWKSKFFQKNKL